jgi:hypothetical protein
MVNIFLEAKSDKTPESCFMKALIKQHFPHATANQDFKMIYVDGKDNLPNVVPQLLTNTSDGGSNLVIFDADTPENGGGFTLRQQDLLTQKAQLNVSFDLFLYPANGDDGDVEVLMERIARKDKHARFFSCFQKYEECILHDKDASGKPRYKTPNRKGKLHTYINAMPLNNRQSRNLGSGQWLFDNPDYWDLNSNALQPLISFLSNYLPG